MSPTAWLVAAAILLSPTFALAQRSEPGAVAIGADVGLTPGGGRDTVPVGAGPNLEAFYERNWTRRTSVRLRAGWTQLDHGNSESRFIRTGGEFVWKGRGDRYNGFVGAGAGLYVMTVRATDDRRKASTAAIRAGVSVFLGEELFATRTLAIRCEGRLHVVPNATAFDRSALALTIGMKKYF